MDVICKTNNRKASLCTGLSLHQSVEADCGGICGSRVTNEQQKGQGGQSGENFSLETMVTIAGVCTVSQSQGWLPVVFSINYLLRLILPCIS